MLTGNATNMKRVNVINLVEHTIAPLDERFFFQLKLPAIDRNIFSSCGTWVSRFNLRWRAIPVRLLQVVGQSRLRATFSEQVQLWKPKNSQPIKKLGEEIRRRRLLNNVFNHDKTNVDSKPQAIKASLHLFYEASDQDFPQGCRTRPDFIKIPNHQAFILSTGAVMSGLIEAETISGVPALIATLLCTMLSTCASPPADTTISWCCHKANKFKQSNIITKVMSSVELHEFFGLGNSASSPFSPGINQWSFPDRVA